MRCPARSTRARGGCGRSGWRPRPAGPTTCCSSACSSSSPATWWRPAGRRAPWAAPSAPPSSSAPSSSSYGWRSRSCSAPTPARRCCSTCPRCRCRTGRPGSSIGGSVTLQGLLAAVRDGAQIAAMIACVGAANALANPSRLLKAVPGALYEVGVVRGRRAHPRPAGRGGRPAAAPRPPPARPRRTAGSPGSARWRCPALEGALQRSLQLAASMDGRGYGRRADVAPRARRATAGAGPRRADGDGRGPLRAARRREPRPAGAAARGRRRRPRGDRVPAGRAGAASGRATARTRGCGAEWVTVLAGAVPAIVLVAARAAGMSGILVPVNPIAWPVAPAGPGPRDPRRPWSPPGRPRSRRPRPRTRPGGLGPAPQPVATGPRPATEVAA